MALRACRECGSQISTRAASCPHCGAPVKKQSSSAALGCLAVIVVLVCAGLFNRNDDAPPAVNAPANAPARPAVNEAEQRASDRLAYLNDLPEVAWYEVRGNNAYIGFYDPRNWQAPAHTGETIVRAAALHGHRAYGSGFHVWAINQEDRGKIGGANFRYYAECTARNGAVQDYNKP